MLKKGGVLVILITFTMLGVGQQKVLHIYTSLPEVEAKEYIEAFEKKYPDIDVVWVRLSTGAMLARIRAEAANPQASLWFGGPTDAYIVAAKEGLLAPYKDSPGWQNTPSLYKDPDGYWTGFGVNYLCFVSNKNFLEERGLTPPRSWNDLLHPEFFGRLSMAFPYTSGTGYARLATLIFIFGEEKAFELEAAYSKRILEYTESGPGCIPKVGLGEAAVGITYVSDVIAAIAQGYPIIYSFPEEGTSYTTDCIALIKGGPEPELAKIFYEWLLSAEAQELFKKYHRIGLNPSVTWPEGVTPPKLIDYDFEWAALNRDRLIKKWREITGF
ncbi:MAG: ABC transporter substrate-binding protein [Candidatus Bathyarchaeia archaeon]